MIKRRLPFRIRKVLDSFLQSVYVYDVKLHIPISVYFNARRPYTAALSTFIFLHRTQLLCAEIQRPSREGVELASMRWILKILIGFQLLFTFMTLHSIVCEKGWRYNPKGESM